jgi:hypothetical protein
MPRRSDYIFAGFSQKLVQQIVKLPTQSQCLLPASGVIRSCVQVDNSRAPEQSGGMISEFKGPPRLRRVSAACLRMQPCAGRRSFPCFQKALSMPSVKLIVHMWSPHKKGGGDRKAQPTTQLIRKLVHGIPSHQNMRAGIPPERTSGKQWDLQQEHDDNHE